MNDSLWTVERVAEFLAFKPSTVRQMAREQRIPSYRIGNKWRFDPQQIGQWLGGQAIYVSATYNQNDLPGACTCDLE